MAEEHEEIEVIDVEMTESEIDEMISHLIELKEHKTNVQFPIAADVDLSVTYDLEHTTDVIGEVPLEEHHEEIQTPLEEKK